MNQTPEWILAIAAWPLSQQIDNSVWMFAVIECVHLLGLVMFGGALLAVDLSVLGMGFKAGDISTLERKSRRWLWIGLLFVVISGFLMLISEPEKCYFNPAFKFKMAAFQLGALMLIFFRHRAFARISEHTTHMPGWLKVSSAVSLGLWLAVGVGGRAIGFY